MLLGRLAARRLFSTETSKTVKSTKSIVIKSKTPFIPLHITRGRELREFKARMQEEMEAQRQNGTADQFQRRLESFLALWSSTDEQKETKQKAVEETAKVYERRVNENGEADGRGRRKTARAHVWIKPGDGLKYEVTVEGESKPRLMVDYFDTFQLARALEPLRSLDELGNFDIRAVVSGGGKMGQAGAVSLGVARALLNFNPEWRELLRAKGHLTRDAREVERKKPGQKKARKKFQWVKR